jgi:hypothetical protein
MYQIDSGFNKAVYSGNFLKTLIPKINRKAADPKLAEEVNILTSAALYTTSYILPQLDVLLPIVGNTSLFSTILNLVSRVKPVLS